MGNNPAPHAQDSFEHPACLLCGGEAFQPIFPVRDRLQFKGGGRAQAPERYNIVACAACGFRFLKPRPRAQDLAKYYQSATYGPHQRRGGGAVGWLYRLLRPFSVGHKAGQVAGGLTAGAILDVGCGTGEFLAEMQRRGWRTLGIERDESAAAIARESGCEVLIGDPLEIDLADRRFNLITLWHALEHLPNPRAALSKLAAHLKPEGRLAIALPNPDSLDARFYKARWAAWDAPRHLYHFRPSDVQRLISQIPGDFELIRTASLPLDPFYHALLSEVCWSQGLTAMIKGIRGGMIGLISYIVGFRSLRGSSILYLYQKA